LSCGSDASHPRPGLVFQQLGSLRIVARVNDRRVLQQQQVQVRLERQTQWGLQAQKQLGKQRQQEELERLEQQVLQEELERLVQQVLQVQLGQEGSSSGNGRQKVPGLLRGAAS